VLEDHPDYPDYPDYPDDVPGLPGRATGAASAFTLASRAAIGAGSVPRLARRGEPSRRGDVGSWPTSTPPAAPTAAPKPSTARPDCTDA